MSEKYQDAIAKIIEWIEKFDAKDAESREIASYLKSMLWHVKEGNNESAFKYFNYLREVIE